MRNLKFILFFFCSALLFGQKEQLQQSFYKLTTSNGLIVSVFDTKANRIDYVYPHIFARIDSGRYIHPFVGNIILKGNEKPKTTNYLQNTHIIKSDYKDFSIYYLASFTKQDRVFYAVARGKKSKIEKLDFTAEIGEGTEVSGMDHLVNAREDLPAKIHGNALVKTILKPYKNSEYEKYFIYSYTDSLQTDAKIVEKAFNQIKNSKISLVDSELKYMRNLINKAPIPAQATVAEKNVLEQAVSLFKMSQVSDKEIFPYSHGQVMAALRPGLWHEGWVRDGVYIIEGMYKMGLKDEAKKAMEFMLKAPNGRYKNFVYKGKTFGPSIDYQISLTGYYGNGNENCDPIPDGGPNIEYDDFGLFLTTFCNYVNETGDFAFYKKWNEIITKKLADVILDVIDENNSLIKPDSGPWEHHLDLTKQYTFTSGVNARGLELFAELQKKQGLPYQKYLDASQKIKNAILKNMLVNNEYFKGNADDKNLSDHEYWDGGAHEIFANDLIKDKNLFKTHIAAYDKTMRIEGERDGYIRLISADPYENQEWVFMNLRVALSHIKLGDRARAYKMLQHVTDLATINYNTIPEMYSNAKQSEKVTPEFYSSEIWCNCVRKGNHEYIGMVPMIGYGAGAYVISLLEYYKK